MKDGNYTIDKKLILTECEMSLLLEMYLPLLTMGVCLLTGPVLSGAQIPAICWAFLLL